jgi:hypothetical protein
LVRVGSGVRFSPAAPVFPVKSALLAQVVADTRYRSARTRREPAPEGGENVGRMLLARSALSIARPRQLYSIPEQGRPRFQGGAFTESAVSENRPVLHDAANLDSGKIANGPSLCKPRRADGFSTVQAPDRTGGNQLHSSASQARGHGVIPHVRQSRMRGQLRNPKLESRATLTPCAPQPERWRQPRYGDVQPEASSPA